MEGPKLANSAKPKERNAARGKKRRGGASGTTNINLLDLKLSLFSDEISKYLEKVLCNLDLKSKIFLSDSEEDIKDAQNVQGIIFAKISEKISGILRDFHTLKEDDFSINIKLLEQKVKTVEKEGTTSKNLFSVQVNAELASSLTVLRLNFNVAQDNESISATVENLPTAPDKPALVVEETKAEVVGGKPGQLVTGDKGLVKLDGQNELVTHQGMDQV